MKENGEYYIVDNKANIIGAATLKDGVVSYRLNTDNIIRSVGALPFNATYKDCKLVRIIPEIHDKYQK